MDRLTCLPCGDFTAVLASRTPVPGGGGAAALAGALGAALCAMAGNYTAGNPKYADTEEQVRNLVERSEALRVRLLDLAEEDAAAFEAVSRAWAMPKDAPERPDAVEKAGRNAAQPPLEMVRCCAGAVELLAEMAEKASPMLLSDVGCGAVLSGAAMRCAALNVFVNTRSLKDRESAAALEAETDALLSRWLPEAERISETVSRRLRGG